MIINLNHGDPKAVAIVWTINILALLLMWLIGAPIAFFWIKNLSYTIHGDGIRVCKGIITKTQQNIPFRAITDFALERTLFDRMLGIGSIKVQTAGQSHNPSGYEGKLGGLVEFEEWHEDLKERLRVLHPGSEPVTNYETGPVSDTGLLQEILKELQAIRKELKNG
jgi:uncharacterized membrane protein YdbT with pleckstrin-like domain